MVLPGWPDSDLEETATGCETAGQLHLGSIQRILAGRVQLFDRGGKGGRVDGEASNGAGRIDETVFNREDPRRREPLRPVHPVHGLTIVALQLLRDRVEQRGCDTDHTGHHGLGHQVGHLLGLDAGAYVRERPGDALRLRSDVRTAPGGPAVLDRVEHPLGQLLDAQGGEDLILDGQLLGLPHRGPDRVHGDLADNPELKREIEFLGKVSAFFSAKQR